MRSFVVLTISAVLALAGIVSGQPNYRGTITSWRAQHELELKADDGWLTVVGLFWLKEGRNAIGSGPGYDVQLTDNFKSGDFGEIQFHDGRAVLNVRPGIEATADGKAFSGGELASDEKGKPTSIKTGSQTLLLIKREKHFGIRVRDADSKERREFTRLNWYEIDPAYRVIAHFEKYQTPREVLVPNVLGGEFKMSSPGMVKFRLGNRLVTLETIDEGDGKLFIIFRDLTSRTTTDAAGRFLYADKPAAGSKTVVLDFNKAENPPCAFTSFATCPLPRLQNRLEFEIPAGEKRYEYSHAK